MKIDAPEAQALIKVLQHPIDQSFSVENEDHMSLLNRWDEKARSIFEKSPRGRSPGTISAMTLNSSLTEFCLARHLARHHHFLSPLLIEINDERQTGQYDWDVKYNGLKLEVKVQSFASDQKRFLSTSDAATFENAVRYHELYDLMTVFFWDLGDCIPWLVLDPSVFESKRDLWVRSTIGPGMYLKMDRAKEFYVEINKPMNRS